MAQSPEGAMRGENLGIDLGKTSVVAAFVATDGETSAPQLLHFAQGNTTLRTLITFDENFVPHVDPQLAQLWSTAPSHIIDKPLAWLNKSARDLVDRWPELILQVNAEDEAVAVIGDKTYSATDFLSILLHEVYTQAQASLPHIKELSNINCVIAVPVYFGEVERKNIQSAAQKAGLNVLKFVHEPTAVALAMRENRQESTRLLIVDIGGTDTKISVLQIKGNVFDVVAFKGVGGLGGARIDETLASSLLRHVPKPAGLTVRRAVLRRVLGLAEIAKRQLRHHRVVDLKLPFPETQGQQVVEPLKLRIEQRDLHVIENDFATRVLNNVHSCLRDKNIDTAAIDAVYLVGGGSQSPMIQSLFHDAFASKIHIPDAPETIAAKGAARLAHRLERRARVRSTARHLNKAIGIALPDGRYLPILDKGARIPVSRRVMLPTNRDQQRSLELDLFQGDTEDLIAAEYIGTVVFTNIPSGAAAEIKLPIDLRLDVQQKLWVSCPNADPPQVQFVLDRKLEPTKLVEVRLASHV